MKYRSAFCTLDQVIRQLELSSGSDYDLATSIDTLIATKYANTVTRLHDLIYDQSAALADAVGRVGIPYRYTHTLKGQAWRADYGRDPRRGMSTLFMPDDLLAIVSYTWAGVALDSDDFDTLPPGQFPAFQVGIYDGVSFTLPNGHTESVALVGIWGYHNNPAEMWLDSGDTVQTGGGINSSATSITVSNADGLNPNGVKRFETLQYLQIEDEYLLVTAINTGTNVLTVKRGVNGSTAAAHAQGVAIETFVPDTLFESATRRRVVYLYNNPGETRRIVPLPDGTLELGNEDKIPLPPMRYTWGTV